MAIVVVKRHNICSDGNLPGQTAWEGVVEVFEIKGHPKASRVYAWSHLDKEDDSDERFVAVLGVPPVDSALRAVHVSIAADATRSSRS
jgi:hypothetical protein